MKEPEPKTKDYNDDYALASASVPHSGTVDSVPYVAMPTDSAIFATVDRLLGGIDWPTTEIEESKVLKEDKKAAQSPEIVPKIESSPSLSLARPSSSSEIKPVAMEMTMTLMLKEAVKYISAALQLLPMPCETKYVAPPKCIEISIEVIGRRAAHAEASEFRLPCRAGFAPVESSFSIANLDELLYPKNGGYDDTVDITRMVTKFAGAHPYCLPLSVDHIYEELAKKNDNWTDEGSEVDAVANLDFTQLLAMSTVPKLLQSGEKFDCRDLYVMSWEMTKFLTMAKTWWETWNTSWANKKNRK